MACSPRLISQQLPPRIHSPDTQHTIPAFSDRSTHHNKLLGSLSASSNRTLCGSSNRQCFTTCLCAQAARSAVQPVATAARGSSSTSQKHVTHAAKQTTAVVTSSSNNSDNVGPKEEFDVVVIGAGIGGLSCAAMLAYYGFKVVCCESHSVPGGTAHCWSRRGVHFDSGTALFFGLPAAATPAAAGVSATASAAAGTAASAAACSLPSGALGSVSDNPLAAVLVLLEEPLDLMPYGPERTCLVFPGRAFRAQIGSSLFPEVVRQLWGSQAQQEWLNLQQLCRDLAAAAVAMPPMVVRYDAGIALTAALRRPARMLRFMAAKPPQLGEHVMFSELVDSVVHTRALREFMDVLCQGTSGARAAHIPAAYMVRAFSEMYQPGTQLQWPRGGPQALADALARGLRKHGSKLMLNSHIQSVLTDSGGRACGVQLKDGRTIRARKAVVSNASVWDTQQLVPPELLLPEYQQHVASLQPSDSFVHLHAVVDVPAGIDPGHLPVHTYFLAPALVGDTGWPTLTISTAVDDSLAPPGKQVLHAYMSEPFSPWSGLQRGSEQYQLLKQQKAETLWGLIDQVVPWARQHLDFQTIGTPLTHQRFRRRLQGAYGPKNVLNPLQHETFGNASSSKAASSQPEAVQPMKGLYCCGDCTFPWIGTPAVAASGMWVANTLAPVWKHWRALDVVDR